MIVKAYRIGQIERAKEQTDAMTGRQIYAELRGLYEFTKTKKRAFAVACCVLADVAHADELAALLSEICLSPFL